jgi:hypothetical protein
MSPAAADDTVRRELFEKVLFATGNGSGLGAVGVQNPAADRSIVRGETDKIISAPGNGRGIRLTRDPIDLPAADG